MGTSMSDSNSVMKSKFAPRSKFINSGTNQHKSLKKIQSKNSTENPRYLSQKKIGERQSNKQEKQVNIKKTDPEYYHQNDFTPAFSSEIKDKDAEMARAEFQINKGNKSSKIIKPKLIKESYFYFGDKAQSYKQTSQKSQNSKICIQQSQLKLPLSSLVKSNAQPSLISFSQNPSSQNAYKKGEEKVEDCQKEAINEVLKMLKEEKQQHCNKIKKYLPKSKNLRQSYFTYGLSSYQTPKSINEKLKTEGALKQSKFLENKKSQVKEFVKDGMNIQQCYLNKNQIGKRREEIDSQIKASYCQVGKKSHNIMTNQKNKTRVKDQMNRRVNIQNLQKIDRQMNQKLNSKFSHSSKTRSEKRLNLLYF